MKYIDLQLNQPGQDLYWAEDDEREAENLQGLLIINVTIQLRFSLTNKQDTWCLKLGSGEGTKQYNIGFHNPIPPCIDEC
jgi:hypothetical protein